MMITDSNRLNRPRISSSIKPLIGNTSKGNMMMSAGTVLQLGGKLDTVQKWSDTLDKCFDKTYEGYNRPIPTQLRGLAVRLVKSDPYIMFNRSC